MSSSDEERVREAAPELLAALKELEDRVMHYGVTLDDDARHSGTVLPLFRAIERARAAIAKAEGQRR